MIVTNQCVDCCQPEPRCTCVQECHDDLELSPEDLTRCIEACRDATDCTDGCRETHVSEMQDCRDDRDECFGEAMDAWLDCIGNCVPYTASCFNSCNSTRNTARNTCTGTYNSCTSAANKTLNICLLGDEEDPNYDWWLGGGCQKELNECLEEAHNGDAWNTCSDTLDDEMSEMLDDFNDCTKDVSDTLDDSVEDCTDTRDDTRKECDDTYNECHKDCRDTHDDCVGGCNESYRDCADAAQDAADNCYATCAPGASGANCRASCSAAYNSSIESCVSAIESCAQGCQSAYETCIEKPACDNQVRIDCRNAATLQYWKCYYEAQKTMTDGMSQCWYPRAVREGVAQGNYEACMGEASKLESALVAACYREGASVACEAKADGDHWQRVGQCSKTYEVARGQVRGTYQKEWWQCEKDYYQWLLDSLDGDPEPFNRATCRSEATENEFIAAYGLQTQNEACDYRSRIKNRQAVLDCCGSDYHKSIKSPYQQRTECMIQAYIARENCQLDADFQEPASSNCTNTYDNALWTCATPLMGDGFDLMAAEYDKSKKYSKPLIECLKPHFQAYLNSMKNCYIPSQSYQNRLQCSSEYIVTLVNGVGACVKEHYGDDPMIDAILGSSAITDAVQQQSTGSGGFTAWQAVVNGLEPPEGKEFDRCHPARQVLWATTQWTFPWFNTPLPWWESSNWIETLVPKLWDCTLFSDQQTNAVFPFEIALSKPDDEEE